MSITIPRAQGLSCAADSGDAKDLFELAGERVHQTLRLGLECVDEVLLLLSISGST